jgi:L-iditol 2-dehydrogenase
MKVARLHAAADIRLAEEPVPGPAPGMSLVRVTAAGICGSDLHWWTESGIGDARLVEPLVLGHENAGQIADGPRAGERVAVDPAIPCERCLQCRSGYRNLCPHVRFAGHGDVDGGMAEFLSWPTALLHPLSERLTDSDGAMLEPLGVAAHALDLGHLRLGGSAAVVGCGPIGLLLIALLRLAGAGMVVAVDPLPHRRQAALRFGADQAHDADLARGTAAATAHDAGPAHGAGGATGHGGLAIGRGAGVDAAFEVAGTDAAVRLAMSAARPGGRVVLAGIPDGDVTSFPASVARRKGLTIAVSRRMNDAYPRAIRLAESGKLDLASLVTHRFALADAAEAMRTAARRDGLKVVVEPGEASR